VLYSDDFWENDYVKRGALSLIPTPVRNLCRSTKSNNATKGIPQSIRDLFRDSPKSYAEKKYARFANPNRTIRTAPEEPDDWISDPKDYNFDVLSDGTWSEGEDSDTDEFPYDESEEYSEPEEEWSECGGDDVDIIEIWEWQKNRPRPKWDVEKFDFEEELRKIRAEEEVVGSYV
jgi:hypothetical protein